MAAENGVAVISAVRTPFAKFGGTLRDFSLPQPGGLVVAEVIRRAQIDPEDVEEVAAGVNLPGSDRSIARQLLIEAGIPPHRVAYTVDRACCSSLAATSMISRAIRLGDVQIGVAGGTENMSRVPYFLTSHRWGHSLGDITLKDQLVIACPMTGKPRAVQAGEEAVELGVSREEQDAWAARSHQKYVQAREAGKFADEVMPVEVPKPRGESTLFTEDESVRPDTTVETCEAEDDLRQSDGDRRQRPRAQHGRLRDRPDVGRRSAAVRKAPAREADRLGDGFGSSRSHRFDTCRGGSARPRTRRDVDRRHRPDRDQRGVRRGPAGLDADHGRPRPAKAEELRAKTNVNGGAIAIGHPTGATGARLVMTLVYEFRRRRAANGDDRPYYGLATICGGIGEAEAIIVEVAD